MTWGPRLEFLLGLKKDGVSTPALDNRPTLPPHLQYWKTAFMELSGSRAYSQFGQPMPLPITELLAYCEFFGIKELSERESFFHKIRAMDAAYVETVGERIRRETDKKRRP